MKANIIRNEGNVKGCENICSSLDRALIILTQNKLVTHLQITTDHYDTTRLLHPHSDQWRSGMFVLKLFLFAIIIQKC